MINLPEVRQSFEMEGRAGVRRNLAGGVYSPEVANAATRWLDDQEDQAATRLQDMISEQQSLSRRAVVAATVAAVGSLLTLTLVGLNLLHRR